jgi:hypothetical protein
MRNLALMCGAVEGTIPINNNMEGTPPLRGVPYPTL